MYTHNPNVPAVVIIRHGKTGHNKLGLFTGWEDVSLAPEGRAEATKAGQMLRRHGVRFDVVYTSWLQVRVPSCLPPSLPPSLSLYVHPALSLASPFSVHPCLPQILPIPSLISPIFHPNG